jgi:hypothetical protein
MQSDVQAESPASAHRVAAASASPGIVKRLACAVIAAGAGLTIGLSAHDDQQTTAAALNPASIAVAVSTKQTEACLYHAIRTELPRGATIYVGSPDVAHFQRLVELSTLWAVPVPTQATAQWQVWIAPYTTGPGDCLGVQLMVKHL